MDPIRLLSDKPEAKVTQIQTLKDLICDVENDDVYRSVTRGVIGSPEVSILSKWVIIKKLNVFT